MKKTQAFLGAALGVLGLTGGVAHAQQSTAPIATPPPAPVTVSTRWNGSPETREEDRRFHVNGRFQYDMAYTDADCANAACTGVNNSGIRSYARRAFLGVDGRLTDNWRYNVKLDFNLANNGGASVRADDLYLEYAGTDWSFIVGNNNAVSPMEDRDSSLNIPFNERSFLVTASGVGKRPGIAWITNGGNWSFGANLSGNDTLDTTDSAANGGESYFVGARGTWAPIFEQTPDGTTVLHLGAYARHRDVSGGNGNAIIVNALPGSTATTGLLTYSPGALSNKSSNNAAVGGATSDDFFSAEFAFQMNAFGVDGEWGQISTNDAANAVTTPPTRTGNNAQLGDADITGYYFDVFWSPTGESRRYNAADGSFGAVAPFRTLGSDGGIGHIMLSARYENIDLSDANFGANRNETKAWTLGVSWVPIQHVKFQLNYSQTDIDYTVNNAAHVDNTVDAATLRTQFDW